MAWLQGSILHSQSLRSFREDGGADCNFYTVIMRLLDPGTLQITAAHVVMHTACFAVFNECIVEILNGKREARFNFVVKCPLVLSQRMQDGFHGDDVPVPPMLHAEGDINIQAGYCPGQPFFDTLHCLSTLLIAAFAPDKSAPISSMSPQPEGVSI